MTKRSILLILVLMGVCGACVLGIIGKCMLDDFMFYNFMDHRKALKWNYAGAMKWYRENAERGNPHAQRMLGNILYDSEDYEEALKWYNRAAVQGDCFAQRCLVMMYVRGDGVPQDYVQAYKWAVLSAEHKYGDSLDIKYRGSLKEKMTAEQIAEAEKLVEEFEPEVRDATFKDWFYGLIIEDLKST